MTLRQKTFLSILGTLGALLAVVFIVASTLVMQGFLEIERRTTEQNLERAVAALEHEIANLGVKLTDWSAWDDSCRFIEDHGTEFLRANLNAASLDALELAFVVFTDTEGRVVFAAGVDPTGPSLTPPPPSLLSMAEAGDGLYRHTQPADEHAGVLVLPEGDYLVASRPIISSERRGPIRGTLVFGRRLDPEVG